MQTVRNGKSNGTDRHISLLVSVVIIDLLHIVDIHEKDGQLALLFQALLIQRQHFFFVSHPVIQTGQCILVIQHLQPQIDTQKPQGLLHLLQIRIHHRIIQDIRLVRKDHIAVIMVKIMHRAQIKNVLFVLFLTIGRDQFLRADTVCVQQLPVSYRHRHIQHSVQPGALTRRRHYIFEILVIQDQIKCRALILVIPHIMEAEFLLHILIIRNIRNTLPHHALVLLDQFGVHIPLKGMLAVFPPQRHIFRIVYASAALSDHRKGRHDNFFPAHLLFPEDDLTACFGDRRIIHPNRRDCRVGDAAVSGIVKSGDPDILRHTDPPFIQFRTDGQRHNIIGADNGIRELSVPLHQFVQRIHRTTIGPFAVCDILIRQFQSVFCHHFTGHLQPFPAVFVFFRAADIKHFFHIVLFDQMRDQPAHTIFVTDAYRRHTFHLHADTDDRHTFFFCFFT